MTLHNLNKVNAAAGEICISDLSLLSRRGELLEMASRMVAEEGYNFKKGFAILKCMERTETSSAVKWPKYDKQTRDEWIKNIDKELKILLNWCSLKKKDKPKQRVLGVIDYVNKSLKKLWILRARKVSLWLKNVYLNRRRIELLDE